MAMGKAILTATLTISVAALEGGPGLAQRNMHDRASYASSEQAHARDINRAMLRVLLQRRADLAQLAGNSDSKHFALAFLDRQITQVRGRLGKEEFRKKCSNGCWKVVCA